MPLPWRTTRCDTIFVGELTAVATADDPERRRRGIDGEATAIHVGGQIGFKIVVARHLVPLAAFLMQPHSQMAILREHILDLHAGRRTDAG